MSAKKVRRGDSGTLLTKVASLIDCIYIRLDDVTLTDNVACSPEISHESGFVALNMLANDSGSCIAGRMRLSA